MPRLLYIGPHPLLSGTFCFSTLVIKSFVQHRVSFRICLVYFYQISFSIPFQSLSIILPTLNWKVSKVTHYLSVRNNRKYYLNWLILTFVLCDICILTKSQFKLSGITLGLNRSKYLTEIFRPQRCHVRARPPAP